MRAFLQGYMQKQAVSPAQMGTAVGAALGLGSGLVGNFLMAKMLGYDGDWKSYLLAGGMGGVIGAASVGSGVKHFQDNPEEFADLLERIEKSPRLEAWHKWQKQSPLMKPVRQGIGRFVTNVKEPTNYDIEDVKRTVRERGIGDILRAVIKDEAMYSLEDPSIYASGGGSVPADMSHAAADILYRGYFDLPPRTSQVLGEIGKTMVESPEDIFTPTGSEGKDVMFNPNTEAGRVFRESLKSDIELGGRGASEASNRVLGGFSVRRPEGVPVVKDPWDFHTPTAAALQKGYLESVGKGDKQEALRRIMNSSRNIFDRSIGNPMTVNARFPEMAPR